MNVTSGPTSQRPFASWDPNGCYWRTSQATFHWASDQFSEIWPNWGSMRNGECSLRPASAPPTSVSDSSVLPTPDASVANDGQSPESFLARQAKLKARGYNANGMGTPLAMAVKLLPTTTARDADSGANATAGRSPEGLARSQNHSGTTLTDAVRLLPTPIAHDAKTPSRQGFEYSLTEVLTYLPTPTTSDAKGPSPNHGRTLSEALDPTRPGKVPSTSRRSNAGGTSSDEEPLHLW